MLTVCVKPGDRSVLLQGAALLSECLMRLNAHATWVSAQQSEGCRVLSHHYVCKAWGQVSVSECTALPGNAHKLQLFLWIAAAQV